MITLDESLNLLTVQAVALSGARLASGEVKRVAITLNIDWAVESRLIMYRFHMAVGVYSLEMEPQTGDLDEIANHKLADVTATIVSEYGIPDGLEVDPEASTPLHEFARRALSKRHPTFAKRSAARPADWDFPTSPSSHWHMPTISATPTKV